MVGKTLTPKELQSMKVVDLRSELRAHDLKVSGLRQELIDRLAKHFKSSKRRATSSVETPPSTKVALAAPLVNHEELAREVDVQTFVQPGGDDVSERNDAQQSQVSHAPTEVASQEEVLSETDSTGGATSSAVSSEASVEPQAERSPVSCAPAEAATSQVPAATSSTDGAMLSAVFSETSVVPQLETSPVSSAPTEAATSQAGVSAETEPTGSVVLRATLSETSVAPQIEAQSALPSDVLPLNGTTVNATLRVKRSASPAKVCESLTTTATSDNGSNASGDVRKDIQESLRVQKDPKPRVVPRAIALSPLSPGAVLAPEVTALLGTPSKDDGTHDSTPMKDARRSWRELCAREAAVLRIDRQGCTSNSQSEQEELNEEAGARAAYELKTTRSISRSRSPQAHKPKGTPIVLRRRRSLEHARSPNPQGCSKRPASTSPESDSSSQSPARRSPERGPRNCLWGRRAQRVETESSIRCQPAQADQHELQKRATELRSELLNTFKARASSSTGVQTPSKSRSPYRISQLQVASTPEAGPETPRSVAASPGGLVATPRLMQRLAAANLLSPGPSPRNLSSAMQDVAYDSKSSSCREQALDSRQHMLAQLTGQMQKCLARLQDPNLDDGSREKYQSIASSIRGQMEKISSFRLLGSSPAIRRGGC